LYYFLRKEKKEVSPRSPPEGKEERRGLDYFAMVLVTTREKKEKGDADISNCSPVRLIENEEKEITGPPSL